MIHTHKDRVAARAGTLFRGDDQELIMPQHLQTMRSIGKNTNLRSSVLLPQCGFEKNYCSCMQ